MSKSELEPEVELVSKSQLESELELEVGIELEVPDASVAALEGA